MEAVIKYVKGEPTNPEAEVALVTTGALMMVWLIVIESVLVPVPAALVAPMVTFEVPMAVGVPLIIPVLELNESPWGRVPITPKLDGAFEAVMA